MLKVGIQNKHTFISFIFFFFWTALLDPDGGNCNGVSNMNSFCYTRTLRPSKGYSLMFDIHSEITSTGDQVLYSIKDFNYKTGWRALKLSQH